MTDVQNGAGASRTTKVTKVSQSQEAALRKKLDEVIQRQAASDERGRVAERAALAARLSGPRPVRNTERGPEPFQPPEQRKRLSRYTRSAVKEAHRYTQGPQGPPAAPPAA